jgi:hypothetical protein
MIPKLPASVNRAVRLYNPATIIFHGVFDLKPGMNPSMFLIISHPGKHIYRLLFHIFNSIITRRKNVPTSLKSRWGWSMTLSSARPCIPVRK